MEAATIARSAIGLVLVILCLASASSGQNENANGHGPVANPKNNPVERRAYLRKNNDNDEANGNDGVEPYRLSCELGHFRINTDTIIRTQDSRELGAKYVNETELPSQEDCFLWCCQVQGCNVAVFEEKDRGSCYLFDCGPPTDFRCKFTSHHRYTSAILDTSDAAEVESNRQSPTHRHRADGKDYAASWSHPNDEHATALKNLHNQVAQPPGGNGDTAVVATVAPPSPPSSSRHTADHPQNRKTETMVGIKPNATQIPPVATLKSSSPKAPPDLRNGNSRCPHFQFECRSSGECIAIYNTCDGIPQCSDGSDESAELGCPPDGRKFFGSVPTSTSHVQQQVKPMIRPVMASPEGHNIKQSLPPSAGTLQKNNNNNPKSAYATTLANRQNNQPQQYANLGAHPAKSGHHGQRIQYQDPVPAGQTTSTLSSPDEKFVKDGYDGGSYHRSPQSSLQPVMGGANAEGDPAGAPGKHQTQVLARGRYNDNDRRPYVPNSHAGSLRNNNGNTDEVSQYVYNPNRGNPPSLGSQDYPRQYEGGGQPNVDDPLMYQHKGHEEGIRKLNSPAGQSIRPVNNGRQEDESNRHYYGAQSGFDAGHQQAMDSIHETNQYGLPSREDNYNMREYYDGANGYAPSSSSSADFILQGNQYQPQGQYAPQDPSYSRHSMDGSAVNHALNQNEDWSSAHHDPNYSGSYSRNGPYSDSHVESNVYTAYNGEGGSRHSAAGAASHSDADIAEPKLTVHVVSETPNKYWPAKTSSHDPKEDTSNQRNGPSADEEALPDYLHHLKSGDSDDRLHYHLPGLTSPSKEHQQPPAVPEANQSEGDRISSSGLDRTSKNYIEKVVPKPVGPGHLERGTLQAESKLVAKPQSRVEVNLAEVDISRSDRSSESSAAILALTLGLSITGLLLVLVGCRLRMIRRRLLRGRSPYAHDADYLVNGMYL